MERKKDIRALTKEQLRDFFVSNGDKAFRGNQVYEWLWQKSAHSFEDMTNISLETREMLKEHFVINHIKVDQMQRSSDGTIKNAVRLYDDLIVESVLIPTHSRTTACVSSQVGCSLDCRFCATSRLKRMRNLNADEIVDQVVAIDNESRLYYNRPLSNIVFMGMGEPLMNYNNVLKAIDKITSREGLGMSPKRITLSTSGVPKMIRKMADDEVKFNLAVSLHSAINEVRTEIMPFNATFPLEDLRGRLVDSSPDGFLMAMDISCHSLMRLCKKAENLMKDGGSVTAMSYIGAERVVENYNLMGPVKAALESSVRYLAYELGEANIRVNAISAGPVATRAASGLADFDKLLQKSATFSPLNKALTAEDVGSVAAFLTSTAAAAITGEILYVDCGYHIVD